MRSSAPPSRSAGFTMLEVIVALLVFAIIGALAIPRLSSNLRREVVGTLDEIEDLLTMFAQREMLAETPVQLWYDPDARWILVSNLEDPDEPGRGEPPVWVPDRYISPVRIPDQCELLPPLVDGESLGGQTWTIVSRPGEARPDIQLSLYHEGETFTVGLPTYAITPWRSDALVEIAEDRQPVDLDGLGRYREDW